MKIPYASRRGRKISDASMGEGKNFGSSIFRNPWVKLKFFVANKLITESYTDFR